MRGSAAKRPLALVCLALLLAAAFYWGGNAPGLRGWSAQPAPAPDALQPLDAPAAAQENPEPELPPAAEPSAMAELPPAEEQPPTAEPPPAEEPLPAAEPPLTAEPIPAEESGACYLSVSCAVLLPDGEGLPESLWAALPVDGWVLSRREVALEPGDSVFDALRRGTRAAGVHLEFTRTPLTGGVYIEGIGNLYEFDAGEGSGWLFRVNGVFSGGSSAEFLVSAGDEIEFLYTRDLGRDVGARVT